MQLIPCVLLFILSMDLLLKLRNVETNRRNMQQTDAKLACRNVTDRSNSKLSDSTATVRTVRSSKSARKSRTGA